MSWLNEKIAEQWRCDGKRYAVGINEQVRIAMESNWEQEQDELEETRYDIAVEVMAMIRGANLEGDTDRLHQELPPASWPLVSKFESELQAIRPLAFLKNGSVLVYTGSGSMYLADQETIKKLPELNFAGISPDGSYLALVDQIGIRIVSDWGSDLEKEVSFFSWRYIQRTIKESIPHIRSLADEAHPEAILREVIPFGDGKQLLLVCKYGIYLLGHADIELIHPDIMTLEENDYEEIDIDLAHGAVSSDGRWLAYGSQGSEHLLKDLLEGTVYEFEPESSYYPCYALFSYDSREVWYNSCYFYSGETIRVPVSATVLRDSEEEGSILEVNSMQVCAGVTLKNGHILGDAYGYLHLIDLEGKEVWRYFVGSTISGMVVTADGEQLAVGTFGGMLHFIDLNSGCRSEYSIGTANILETRRWILWRNEEPLRW